MHTYLHICTHMRPYCSACFCQGFVLCTGLGHDTATWVFRSHTVAILAQGTTHGPMRSRRPFLDRGQSILRGNTNVRPTPHQQFEIVRRHTTGWRRHPTLTTITRQRPYRVECTGSLPNSEVKRRRARLVLGWGTAREDLRVLLAFCFVCCVWVLGALCVCACVNNVPHTM